MRLVKVTQPKPSKPAPAKRRKQASLHSNDVTLFNGFIHESLHGHHFLIDPFSGGLMSTEVDD